MCFMTPFWSGWESPIGEPSIVLFAVQSEPIPFFFFFAGKFRLFGPLRSVDDPTLVSRILPFVGWSEMICFLFRLLRVYCHRGVIILYIAQ